MNQTIAKLSELQPYDRLSLGGYDWILYEWGNDKSKRELHSTGEKPLTGCRIREVLAKDGEATYAVNFDHPTLVDLRTKDVTFPSLAEAIEWATHFEWYPRKAGSLTWLAASEDSPFWHTHIGNSQAKIFIGSSVGTYSVSRWMRFGNQKVEFDITDMAFGKDDTKTITTFEQASAIALTMTDYVLELMRT